METSTNINEILDKYEESKKLFEEYVMEKENDKDLIVKEEVVNNWTVGFNDEMVIFNITEDTKLFFKEYIEINDKNITQWMIYKNDMTIYNISQKTQEIFVEYMKNKVKKSKEEKTNVQYYELKPANIKTSRLLYTPESYTETEEIMKEYQIRDVDLAECVSMDLTTNVTDEMKERFVEFMQMKDKEIMDANLILLENTNFYDFSNSYEIP